MLVLSLVFERNTIVNALKKGTVLSAACGICNGATNYLVMVIIAAVASSVFFPVLSAGQLIITFITFINPEGKGKRVLFVGNSITRHGIKHDIGWHNDWGMAASALEKDYVHIVAKEISHKDNEATFCVCQAAEWECNWYDGENTFELFKAARDFKADIIVMRLVENCLRDHYNSELFIKEYGKLVSYLNGSGKAEIIITTGFWKHIADGAIREYALKNEYTLVELNDLGEDDKMKAIGLFEHEGVANHPGDKGMAAIAERILKTV